MKTKEIKGMKIAIITRHAITNYGSILQTYASQKILRNLGHSVEIIDYIRYDEDYKKISRKTIDKSSKWSSNCFVKFIYTSLHTFEYFIMGRKFEIFRKHYLDLSFKKYRTLEQLKKDKPKADLYCTGSDQVWGPIGNDKFDAAYFFEFLDKSDKCISYAGSFGKDNIDKELEFVYKSYFEKYIAISVREKSAIKIIDSIGITRTVQVLDPTLLLNDSEWSSLIKKDIKKEYILIYQIHSNKRMNKYAVIAAKKMNLPLIRITPTLHQIFRGGKVVLLPNLDNFISYIKNAKLLITDSFHGTAFAINFGTQFINFSPGLTETRNLSILELFGLENRMITSYDDFSLLQTEINFSKVREQLEFERYKSLYWLDNTIQKLDKI
ncbi:MAG: hypothetical protein K0R54_4269 [Clostridiaceae bacterium]|jgi:hypothetical protein|nr:hypothetical protein [Clostridiaceae bacterium]